MSALLLTVFLALLAPADNVVLVAESGGGGGGACTVTESDGLVDFWDFEDSANMGLSVGPTATDLIENNQSGTQTTTSGEFFEGAAAYDISSSSILRGTSYTAGPYDDADADHTTCIAIYHEADPAASNDMAIRHALRARIYADSGADDLKVNWGGGGTEIQTVVTNWAAGDTNYICVVVEGNASANDDFEVYLNGSSVATYSAEWAEITNLGLGNDENGNQQGDSFVIDSVSIWDEALSAAQILNLNDECEGRPSDT